MTHLPTLFCKAQVAAFADMEGADIEGSTEAGGSDMEDATPRDSMCVNCGTESPNAAPKCHSCAHTVCSFCMVEEEGCCMVCLETFRESPAAKDQHSPAGFQMNNASMPWEATMNPEQAGCYYVDAFSMSPQSWFLYPMSPTVDAFHMDKPCAWADVPVEADEAVVVSIQPAMTTGVLVPTPLPWDAANSHDMERSRTPPTPSKGRKSLRSLRMQRQSEHVMEPAAKQTRVPEEGDGRPPAGFMNNPDNDATTMMIRNIPCRFGHSSIVEAIESMGFAGTYDFVYLPKRNGTHDGNIGYAFVNFKTEEDASRFAVEFSGFQFPGTMSAKQCIVKHAHHQGFNGQDRLPCN